MLDKQVNSDYLTNGDIRYIKCGVRNVGCREVSRTKVLGFWCRAKVQGDHFT